MRPLRVQFFSALCISILFVLFTTYYSQYTFSWTSQAPDVVIQSPESGSTNPEPPAISPLPSPDPDADPDPLKEIQAAETAPDVVILSTESEHTDSKPPASLPLPSPSLEPEPEPEIKAAETKSDDEPTSTRRKYKPTPTSTSPPIVDNFPLAANAHSAAELPPIPPWNKPPNPHVNEKTPLLIGFTRNWRLLQQTVVSYVTAGWPPEDIYVIENTGVMRSNELGLLSIQNPFFLNHTRLHMFGVNIVRTPTLLSFSQLQNFYVHMAIENNWTTYFYGHMDVLVLPYEDRYMAPRDSTTPYDGFKSIYQRAVDTLRLATASSTIPDPNASDPNKPWAARFFAYDRLTLVNREAYESIGAWDTAIPYYNSDCDMHDRLKMYGFEYNGPDVEIGNFVDISTSLDDLLVLYRKKDTGEASFDVDVPASEEEQHKEVQRDDSRAPIESRQQTREWISDEFGSAAFKQLFEVADSMARLKSGNGPNGRNTWQTRQTGGQGEPYYKDPEGFEKSVQMLTQAGRNIYAEKWGHQYCDLLPFGLKAGDEWRVEHDWE